MRNISNSSGHRLLTPLQLLKACLVGLVAGVLLFTFGGLVSSSLSANDLDRAFVRMSLFAAVGILAAVLAVIARNRFVHRW